MKLQPTVLVVAPLSGHHATLLRDTIKSLLHDHKVYITDWTDARMVPLEGGGRLVVEMTPEEAKALSEQLSTVS